MIYDLTNPIYSLLAGEEIPPMARVVQKFASDILEDPTGTLRSELMREELSATIKPGMEIAITAGSRQLSNLPALLRELGEFIKSKGAHPFIFPAMGSHGGATTEGQIDILTSFGITEQTMGMPIKATMETVEIAQLEDGTPVYVDKYVHDADGVILINRIKPHTIFHGKYESGVMKMAVVGVGKQKGAEVLHSRGTSNMSHNIERIAGYLFDHSNVLFGVALLENSLDQTCDIKALLPHEIVEQEPELLSRARSFMPAVLLENLDVLIVDRIGKNFSGSGMDPNVTHSFAADTGISNEGRARRIVVFDVSDESHGSVVGIGNADVTTQQLVDKMSIPNTYPNLLTVGFASAAKVPIHFESHELAVKAAIKTALGADKQKLRIVRISDTLHLGEIWASEALKQEILSSPDLEMVGEFEPLAFDENGNLF